MDRDSRGFDELPASASGSGAAKVMDAQPAEIRTRMGAYLICTDIKWYTEQLGRKICIQVEWVIPYSEPAEELVLGKAWALRECYIGCQCIRSQVGRGIHMPTLVPKPWSLRNRDSTGAAARCQLITNSIPVILGSGEPEC